MLKLLGGLLLTAATTAMGVSVAGRLSDRVRILRQLSAAIQIMQGEILMRMTPIPDLLEKLCHEMDAPASMLFANVLADMRGLGTHSFLQIRRDAVRKTPELMLSEEEQAALCDLGYVLGRYGSGEQAAILDYAARRFSGFLEQAKAERKKRGRTSVAVGLAAGLLILLLFL